MRVIKYEEQGGVATAKFVVDAGGIFQSADRVSRVGLFQICRYRQHGLPVTDKADILAPPWLSAAPQNAIKRDTVNANGWFVDNLYRDNATVQSPYYLDSFDRQTLGTLTAVINESLSQQDFVEDHWIDAQGFAADYGSWSQAQGNCVPVADGAGQNYVYLYDTPRQPAGISLEFKVHLLAARIDGDYLLGPGFYWEWQSTAQSPDIADGGISALTASNQIADNDVISCLQMWVAACKNDRKFPVAG